MSTTSRRETYATCALICLVLWSQAANAGTGVAISAPTTIDTRVPELVAIEPPANTVLHADQTIALQWTVTDDNPSTDPNVNFAELWFGELLVESQTFDPNVPLHTWNWTAPDTTSGSVHLVVHTTDAFGNQVTDLTDDFTILSAVTAVPVVGLAPVFALPSPNPFNPLTELRFSLPEAGPVQVTVHDARGFRVGTLLQAHRPAGTFSLRWKGTDHLGRRQAGGTYFFRLEYRQNGQLQQIVHKAVLLP